MKVRRSIELLLSHTPGWRREESLKPEVPDRPEACILFAISYSSVTRGAMNRFLIALSTVTILAGSAFAQLATTTALVGTITDPTGKSIGGAKVVAIETGTRDTYA